MGVGGMFPGLGGGMISSMIPGGTPVAAASGVVTKVICLSQVSILQHERHLPDLYLGHVIRIDGELQTVDQHIQIYHSLLQVVSLDDLKNDGEFHEIVEDMREECGKYGKEMLAYYCFTSMTVFYPSQSAVCFLTWSVTIRIMLQRSLADKYGIAANCLLMECSVVQRISDFLNFFGF